MGNPIQELHALGQSIWYDNISRRLLENGELKQMIEKGDIRGMTSNPSIFQNAIAKTNDYDAALVTMAWAGYTTQEIFDRLVLEDIRAAADLFLPLYYSTQGRMDTSAWRSTPGWHTTLRGRWQRRCYCGRRWSART